MGELEQARHRKELADALAAIKNKYLVMSGKGGVGKTTVAVNLAAAKAAEGKAVGILDVDLHGPSVAVALGLEGSLGTNEKGKLVPADLDYGLKAVSIQGLLKRPDEAVIWRGPKKVRAIEQFFSEVAWGELDYLFIDAPPGTGDESLTVLRVLSDVKPLVVTSGSRLSIADVAKALNFLKLTKRPAMGLIDNQSHYICPKCGLETAIHKREAVKRLAEESGVELLASLPLDLDAAAAAEEGRPLVWSRPGHPFSRLMINLASRL